MHKELLLLKFCVKHGTESQERSRWSNSSMSQSRHCKHKVTKYRDVKDFRLSKRKKKIFPILTAASRYGIKVKWWPVSLQITATWSYSTYKPLRDHRANYWCVILGRITVLSLAVRNIYPYGNLNIFTPLPFPDKSATAQYLENLILHVLYMPKHKKLYDC